MDRANLSAERPRSLRRLLLWLAALVGIILLGGFLLGKAQWSGTDFGLSSSSQPIPSTSRAKQRVLCWVLTHPQNHNTSAKAVAATWGPLCDHLVFMSSSTDSELKDVVPLKIAFGIESRVAVWEKVRLAWIHCYQHFLDDYDWFLKADDDTYVAMSNLRQFLGQHAPDEPHYFGREFHSPYVGVKYAAGGAGYVLSRAALKALGEQQQVMSGVATYEKHEDVEIGSALSQLKIPVRDVVGQDGLHTFLPLEISYLRTISHENYQGFWYWDYSATAKDLEQCCSRYWMTTHYVSPDEMFILHTRVLTGVEAKGKLPSEWSVKPVPKLPYE